jgi:hypothetical protein
MERPARIRAAHGLACLSVIEIYQLVGNSDPGKSSGLAQKALAG